MLRQVIAKALEIKRAELAELSGRGEAGQSPSKTLPSSVQKSPQKLTFYDVVQLARQQAFAEKTRWPNEDLIDLSDTLQPSSIPSTSTTVQSDLTLLDTSDPMFSQHISSESSLQNSLVIRELDLTVETTDGQPGIAVLDAALPLNPPTQDLIGLVELDASGTDVFDTREPTELLALMGTPNPSNSHINELGETLISQHKDTSDQPGLEVVGGEVSLSSGLDMKEAVELCSSPAAVDPARTPQQSGASLIDQEDSTHEVPDNKSIANSIAPSIFSHSSSLTSATGYSLPGITEEDVQAREASLQTNSKAPLCQKGPSLPLDGVESSSAFGNDAQSISGINSPPITQVNQEFPFGPQQIQSEDGVSMPPSLPQPPNINEPDEQGYPWIIKAAHDGNEEIVRKLLVSGANIQATHKSTRRHALAEASLQGHQKIVDLLIEEGCPLECADAEGNTALHHACQKGHLAIAKSLITNGALINASGPEGQSGLHLAMEAPFQNVVMLLLQHKANVNVRDASFRTPLHIGATQGNIAMCNYLLDEGAQLDSRDAQSKTPLQLACEAGHYELSQMMLDRSKLNATNMTFLTAFFATVEHGHVRIAESFFSKGLKLPELKRDFHKPLTLAAKSGCLAMVELIIQEDCDINARDGSGWNALHFASYHGHYQVVEPLLTHGVSPKAITSCKETPLLLAVKRIQFPVAERLLRSDNNSNLVGVEDERGQQPVHHAVRAGSLEIFSLLMSNGGKINGENAFGWQPLHIAAAYGHLALVEQLLQQGANIEEKLGSSSIKKDQTHKIVEEGYCAEARWPYPGSRALHLACEYGHEQIANLLISKGAKMEASCGEGWQPLHHATYFGFSTLVETLLQGGVNPHATTNEGKTALALGFCTTGTPIPEEEAERIKCSLKVAMDRVKRQKNFKVGLKKASTVEDKSNLLRAATFSIMVVSRPQLHKAKTSAQVSAPASNRSDPTSSSHRPSLPRPPHTSPLPLKDSPSELTAHRTSIPNLPAPETQVKIPVLSSTTESSRETADTAATEASSNALTLNTATNEAPQSGATDTGNATRAPSTDTQVSQPKPKLKRHPTFGLAKVGKPGLDMGKLNVAGMGKPAFDIGKQTLEIGSKTLELGKQGFEISKQGLGKSRQGLEMGKKGVEAINNQGLEVGKQGLEMGKRGVDISKQGYKKAKKFARRGVGKKEGKGKAGGPLEGSKQGSEDDAKDNVADNHDDKEGEDSDDKRSEFSLGEFGELGSNDF